MSQSCCSLPAEGALARELCRIPSIGRPKSTVLPAEMHLIYVASNMHGKVFVRSLPERSSATHALSRTHMLGLQGICMMMSYNYSCHANFCQTSYEMNWWVRSTSKSSQCKFTISYKAGEGALHADGREGTLHADDCMQTTLLSSSSSAMKPAANAGVTRIFCVESNICTFHACVTPLHG